MPTRNKGRHPPAPSKGLYANYFEVGHSELEVVVDFGQRYEGQRASPCHTRIVMTPLHAEALKQMLQAALAQYRERFAVPTSDDVS